MTHRIRLVPHLETYRSLHFEPVVRDCRPSLGPEYEAAVPESSEGAYPHGTILKVGRFTEKAQAALERQQAAARAQVEGATQALMAASLAAEQQAQAGGTTTTTAEDLAQAFEGEAMLPSMRYSPTSRPPAGAGGGGSHGSTKVAFKSKVVSRAHAEIWCEEGGKVRPARWAWRDGFEANGGWLAVLYSRHQVLVGYVFEPHQALEPESRVEVVSDQGETCSFFGLVCGCMLNSSGVIRTATSSNSASIIKVERKKCIAASR